MKALTVKQPYAAAMFWTPPKDVENRSTLWAHRGSLAIHAGQRFSVEGGRDMQIVHHPDYADSHLEFGAVIGVVDVVDAHRYEHGCCTSVWGHATGVHLVLDRPRLLAEPIPAFGRLGLWDLPRDVFLKIQRELLGTAARQPARVEEVPRG